MASAILVRWASNHNSLITLDLHARPPIVDSRHRAYAVVASCVSASSRASFLFEAGLCTPQVHAPKSQESRRLPISAGVRICLLGAQVSLSLLLSTMSACFASTLVHWETVDVGMDREHLLSVHVDMHQSRYLSITAAASQPFSAGCRIVFRLCPAFAAPPLTVCGSLNCGLEHCPLCSWPQRPHQWAGAWAGGSGWFRIFLYHGNSNPARTRFFSAADTDKTQRVAIISYSYARQIFGDADPIGQWVGYQPAPNDHNF